jgi:hypothetical protein
MAAKFEIRKILTDLAAAFPEFKPDDMTATLEQYADALQQYKVETIQAAANACRDSCQFFPHIADLKKAIDQAWQATAQKNYEANKAEEFKKAEYTPELAQFIADFRQKMINKGKWQYHRNQYAGKFDPR